MVEHRIDSDLLRAHDISDLPTQYIDRYDQYNLASALVSPMPPHRHFSVRQEY